MAQQPSVQLYSLRTAMEADLDGTLKRVAEFGFRSVEPYAFTGNAEELRRSLQAYGRSAPSGRNGAIDEEDPAKVFATAAQLGMDLVIDPFIPTERSQSADDVKRLAERMNGLADIAETEGVRFGYHNHQWELVNKVDGRHALEVLVGQLDPRVALEVDTFWATVGGADVPALLRAFGDRVRAIHVKDGTVSGDIANVLPSSESELIVSDALARAFKEQKPAGQGEVDVPAILAAAPQALRVVEFDDDAGDVFEGIAESLAWLGENDDAQGERAGEAR
ncbi:sugar phosphate isomerase/epimerase family protein [Brachybacterium nesterenkovii]|uniref:Xylose isomerase domain protein TIM barrel n=1 Tax=Brachybacterium nesterenkovii TaxID=47847 RepID=A0A1X6X3X4_9MICO|nr:sugar phosphate isomerase/epimerase [Brachybacterium nesterenkovii]SLM93482.1 Xylose isomerase domain protein TIM barrel [Brachybacterium nesterenkovii]